MCAAWVGGRVGVCGWIAGPQKILSEFDADKNRLIDMDELRTILTKLDKNKHPPLPKNLL